MQPEHDLSRKPTLSPSKITTYLACPVKYRWTHVDERGRWYLRTKSYYSFGNSLHAVLQRFHDSGGTGVPATNEAVAMLEENWIEAGYSSQDEMMQALAEGKSIVEKYVEQAVARPAGAQTLWVEKTLRSDFGPFDLVGRLDRVDEHPDGTLEVIDYKSGRERVSPEDVATDLAMGCYQVMLRDRFPDRPVKATLVALKTGESASASMSEEDASEFRSDLVVIGREILSRDYENVAPSWRTICRGCDFLPVCLRHEDFERPEGG